MEMILGQYAGTSCTKVFSRMAPVMKGLGYGILSIPTMMTFYYTVIMAWAWYYMFMGFRSTLPWSSCLTKVLEDFSTEKCYSKADNDGCLEENPDTTFYNKTCWLKSDFCQNLTGNTTGRMAAPSMELLWRCLMSLTGSLPVRSSSRGGCTARLGLGRRTPGSPGGLRGGR